MDTGSREWQHLQQSGFSLHLRMCHARMLAVCLPLPHEFVCVFVYLLLGRWELAVRAW